VILHRADGEPLLVSVRDVTDAALSRPGLRPRTGFRLVSITLRVFNAGTTSFPDDIGTASGRLVDIAGNPYVRDTAMSAGVVAPLHPASWVERSMVFEIPITATPAGFRLDGWPGVTVDTAQWSLS
jgi:hypothetical protein